jgi:hypothetical protein
MGRRWTGLRAWSGITGWRFESSSAHLKALQIARLSGCRVFSLPRGLLALPWSPAVRTWGTRCAPPDRGAPTVGAAVAASSARSAPGARPERYLPAPPSRLRRLSTGRSRLDVSIEPSSRLATHARVSGAAGGPCGGLVGRFHRSTAAARERFAILAQGRIRPPARARASRGAPRARCGTSPRTPRPAARPAPPAAAGTRRSTEAS